MVSFFLGDFRNVGDIVFRGSSGGGSSGRGGRLFVDKWITFWLDFREVGFYFVLVWFSCVFVDACFGFIYEIFEGIYF